MHLTRHTQRLLLDGRLDPAQARALAKHLETGCSTCEAALSGPEADGLDGVVDVVLTRLAPDDPTSAGNDLEYARIMRRVGRPRRSGWRGLGLSGVAAGLVAALAGGLLLAHERAVKVPGWNGVKGVSRSAVAPSVRLSAVSVLAARGGEAPVLRKVTRGDVVPGEAILQLQVEVGGATELALARVGRSGEVDPFWQGRATAAGPILLSALDGRPAGYPLAELSGPQRFVALASPTRLTPRQVTAIAGAVAAGRSTETPERPSGISVDVLELTVR
jgi:hypothetical protein